MTAVTVQITCEGCRILLKEYKLTERRDIMGKLAKILIVIAIALAMIKGFGELFYFSNAEVTEEGTFQEEPGRRDKL